jgi:hypothetical protein
MSLVERLQIAALDATVPTSDLLRQVKVIAAKLNLGQVEDWVENELNGYDQSDVPLYRIVRGAPRAHNPFRGWIPIIIDDTEKLEKISTREIGQKVSELEDLLRGNAETTLQISFPPHLVNALNRGAQVPFGNMALLVGRSTVVGILDAVRNRILDWALALEKTGIKGTEISFSAEEKSRAQTSTVTMNIARIGSFIGNISGGDIVGSSVSGKIDTEAIRAFIKQVRQHEKELVHAGIERQKLEDTLTRLDAELQKTTPDQPALVSGLVALRDVVVEASGSLVASGVISMLNQILGTGVPSP